MHPHEHRVREVAYHIWESEGRPLGQEARHWEMACRLAASNESTIGTMETAEPSAKTRKKAAKVAAEAGVPEASVKPVKVAKTKAEKTVKAEDKPKEEKPKKASKATKQAEADTPLVEEKATKAKKSRKKVADSEPLAENESA